MEQFDISIGQMLVSSPNIIYTIIKSQDIFQGRVVMAGWIPNALMEGSFRVYDDLEKFKKDGEYVNFKEIPIKMGEFQVIGITDLKSTTKPSPIENLIRAFQEIKAIDETKSDFGLIRRVLPEKLRELKAAIDGYVNDNPDKKNDNIEFLIDSSISDCENCPEKFSDDLAEDKWFKTKTIKLAKNAAKNSINILFYPWGVWK
ncbi:MAG TPA: hypothetical protein VKQ52_15090 [Puia sp.]|nr:hypothetical protein [Puia sp.]